MNIGLTILLALYTSTAEMHLRVRLTFFNWPCLFQFLTFHLQADDLFLNIGCFTHLAYVFA